MQFHVCAATILVSVSGLLLLPTLSACQDNAPHIEPAARAAAQQFLDDDFSHMYQLFLRRSLNRREKTELWIRDYKDRWVKWTGQLVAISPTGLKFRQIQSTLTFDISVIVNQPQRSQLAQLLSVGKFYTYIARLESYDDVFRTLYLDQGAVIQPTGEGIVGSLAPVPPPLKPTPMQPDSVSLPKATSAIPPLQPE